MSKRSLVWAATGVCVVSFGQVMASGFEPVEQFRSVGVEADAFACEPEIFADGESAEDFEPFDALAAASIACEDGAAMGLAVQVSTIGETVFTATGSVRSETVVGAFDFLFAMSGSSFTVDATLDTPARVRITADLAASAESPVVPSYWVIAKVAITEGLSSVFSAELLPALNGGMFDQSVSHVQRLEPGTYRFHTGADAIITDAIPASGVFEASYDTRFEAFNLADLNLDGTVGIEDFLALLAAWGPNPGHPADLDLDGIVGITDLLQLLGAWGAIGP